MNKNLLWKLVGIIVLTALAIWEVYPPHQKLKPGIDLAGGTSLLYEIDTTGMSDYERSEAAETMIRVLRERIDPRNQMNLIWRPQGNNRIEIQMPLASQETRRKRVEYQQLRDALEARNISRRRVEAALARRDEETTEQAYRTGRAERFRQITDDPDRLARLETLAAAHDAVESAQQALGQSLETYEQARAQLEAAGITESAIAPFDEVWDDTTAPAAVERLAELAAGDAENAALISTLINSRREVRRLREALGSSTSPAAGVLGMAEADEGLLAALDSAWAAVERDNLDLERLTRFLERGPEVRKTEIEQAKQQHPEIAPQINALVAAYDAFAREAGRLDDPEDLRRRLRGSGVLEFRILPLVRSDDISTGEIERYQRMLAEFGPNPLRYQGEDYAWFLIRTPEDFRGDAVRGEFAGDQYVLASNKPHEALLQGAGAWRLTSARPDTDQFGKWAVRFNFNPIGANLFLDLTRNNIGRPLCILLDDQAFSAPDIRSAISDQGQITGNFTQQEVRDLVDKLNAGSLPARLSEQPISMNSVGPTIGRDNIQSGLTAGVAGLIAVAVFMLIYYLVAGALADVALFMNLLLILAVMAFSRATFTMPGIAGLILTIGMAVDANVLIFERIREEQGRGCSLRVAIKNGYARALRTILDANLTTFITALILYLLASEEVKGFALTLMIGIVSSMFTALFVTRTILDLLTEKRILKNQLVMLRVVGVPKINWLGARKVFWIVSIVLVVGAWIVYGHRHANRADNSPYSIEFTGGTSVRVALTDDSLDRDAIERAINNPEAAADPSVQLNARVQQVGDPANHQYEIVTTATNLTRVALPAEVIPDGNADQLLQRIQAAARQRGDLRLAASRLVVEDGRPALMTTQNSQARIRAVLAAVLGDDLQLPAEAFATDDVVTETIRTALRGHLVGQSDLQPTVTHEPITPDLLQRKPYLSEHFRGGLLLTARFGAGETSTMTALQDRFAAYRMKDDATAGSEFAVYPLDAQPADDAPLTGVEIAVTVPDVFYRPDPDPQQAQSWNVFVAEQTNWFTEALQQAETLPWVTQVDASVGRQSMNRALVAVFFSLLAIVAYVWLRFGQVRFGVAAVVALVHDVSIAIGLVAATAWLSRTALGQALGIGDFKIDLPMIAAFLTVIGYSLNDTIVIFDRIRENRGRAPVLTPDIINGSINQTLSRTLLTSFTTLIVLVIMYIWGGPGLRGFNFVLIIGILVGTYSTIAIATPLLYGARVVEAKPREKRAAAGISTTT